MENTPLLEELVSTNAECLEQMPRHSPTQVSSSGQFLCHCIIVVCIGSAWSPASNTVLENLHPIGTWRVYCTEWLPLIERLADQSEWMRDDSDDDGDFWRRMEHGVLTFDMTKLDHLTHLTIDDGDDCDLERMLLPHGDDLILVPALTHLTLNNCIINDNILVPFLETHSGLENLTVNGGTSLSDAMLEAIVNDVPDILELNLDETDAFSCLGRQYIQQSCHKRTFGSFSNSAIGHV